MIVTKMAIPRRTVLRGLGVSLALPLLDGMVPAMTPTVRTAAMPARRFGAVYVPMGMSMAEWTPPSEGPLQLTSITRPLEAFRERLTVLTGLDNHDAHTQDGGPHPRIQTAWLTGVRAKRTEGVDIRAGVSIDQLLAREFGKETQLASLELALESGDLLGTCALGYSCAYNNTISWRTPTTPLPMENNPRAVFERLFGTNDSTDAQARLADIQKDRSILDAVNEKLNALGRRIGPSDRVKLAQYVDAVRDVERRIHKAEEQVGKELPVVDRPMGIPATFEEHAKLMYDLLVLAYQCDLTRVGTFLLTRESSVRPYPEIGVSDGHHGVSHHQDNPEKLARLAKIQVFHMRLFQHFLDKMQATPDGDGSLLDHTLLLYGSGMSNSNTHIPFNLPTLLVSSSTFGITRGQHFRYKDGTPFANMLLTLLEQFGMREETFADSTGRLDGLAAVQQRLSI